MSLQLAKIVFEFLKRNPEKRYTAREIAQWVVKTYPNEIFQKQKKSTAKVIPLTSDSAILQQIVAEISGQRPRLQKHHPEIKTTEGRPRKYYFTDSNDGDEIELAENNNNEASTLNNQNRLREEDLYPLLSDYLWIEHNIYSKRIDEKRSSNSHGTNGNKWLHPDVVGVEDLSRNWSVEVKNCVQQYSDVRAKLWSFEVKILINRSNVREVFFQAVSNSSWANFGYLVASEIEGVDTLNELRILSSLHGIGFIRLEAENPLESQIMIPANERNAVDWDTVNRLCQENKDFLNYIKLIRQFYQTGELRTIDWDISRNGL